ncbi:polymerase, partial [Thermus scotoductus]
GVGFLRLVGAQGYRVQVWLCQKDCQRVGWEWRGDEPMYFPLPQDLPKGEYRLRVLLLSQHRLALRPRYVLEKEVRW